MRIVIQIVLWILIGLLSFMVYNSIMRPVRFNKVKEERYAQVIENLKDIRQAQLAHKTVIGKFEKNPEKLIAFLDTAKFTLTQRRDSSFISYNKILKIDEPRDTIVIDTLGYASVKDSLFKDSDRYRNMMKIAIDGVDEVTVDMDAGFIEKNDLQIAVFEAKVPKDKILKDQDRDLVLQEKEVRSVDGVNGTHLSVGSMTEVNTSGNWPTSYGANDQ